uniref:Uncharacterized protein n=1 Tax=Plectus sambesii TaxID=2011161 RepID=A0A914UIQ1_9BILA
MTVFADRLRHCPLAYSARTDDVVDKSGVKRRSPRWQPTLRQLANGDSSPAAIRQTADPIAAFCSRPASSSSSSSSTPAVMSVVPRLPPPSGLLLPDSFKSLPPVDTEGGTILEVRQHEEIDPNDNCKVQVATYRILSADGTEEVTKTMKRKLKFDVIVGSRRDIIEQGSDGEAKKQSTIETAKYEGDIDGIRPSDMRSLTSGLQGNGHQLMLRNGGGGDAQDQAIDAVLRQTQQTFARMFNDQKSEFIKMFPDLFKNMRTEPSLFALPSTETETIVNPDGSTTTRMSSSRAFSSHYSKQETFINGVRQESKVKTRAFVEYHGPEGGFKVKLTDNANDEASEDEDDEDRRSLAPSELTDTMSAMVFTQPSGVLHLDPTGKAKKRTDKAWHAAKELVDSEQRYVDKLRLLDETFRERVEQENDRSRFLEKDRVARLFANTNSLYRFHNDHLLPQLMDRLRDWNHTRKISDVMRKQAPYLKLYSEYTNNYKRATKEFETCLKKSKRFAQIVQEIERLPECENLPLVSHLICPVQRVMRYQLLLQEYLKHLDPADVDYEDTNQALALVLDAASHANEIMRKLDRYKNVLEVQEMLGNQVALVSPSRELVKQGAIVKTSSKTNRSEERYLFLFNDMLLLCSARMLPRASKYRLRAVFDAAYMQVCEGDNLEKEHSFYVRGSDSENGPSRCVELAANTAALKKEWMDALWNVISECAARRQSFSHTAGDSPRVSPQEEAVSPRTEVAIQAVGACQKCGLALNWRNRGVKCETCEQVICKKCARKTKNNAGKSIRVCESCWNDLAAPTSAVQPQTSAPAKKRHNVLAVSPVGEGVIYSGFVELRSPSAKTGIKRFFVIREDFCLYSFKTEKDSCALTMLPLPGCEVKVDNEKFCFRIKHMNRLYTIRAQSEVDQAKWMAVLELASNAALPGQTTSR